MKITDLIESLWEQYKKHGDLEVKAFIYGNMNDTIEMDICGFEKYRNLDYLSLELPLDGTKRYEEHPTAFILDALKIEEW